MSSKDTSDVVLDLALNPTLSSRIVRSVDLPVKRDSPGRGSEGGGGGDPRFVIYIPTVVLRGRHNPAFSLACRLANDVGFPLVVLATVLDDAHLPRATAG
eukprot:CAMPEP_0194294872 /NCGR_PEP_ID=MMETSP0169-20130528/51927_1 /TAXON_ID=218684 /ORGANISM="Corethron pennatum, Strain L29A3" /LENGTH=99 /DNA_ID=CAMNT_0039043873 /DNA_START=46 /DNA_END=341 /DNA_ORIENTATION=+